MESHLTEGLAGLNLLVTTVLAAMVLHRPPRLRGGRLGASAPAHSCTDHRACAVCNPAPPSAQEQVLGNRLFRWLHGSS